MAHGHADHHGGHHDHGGQHHHPGPIGPHHHPGPIGPHHDHGGQHHHPGPIGPHHHGHPVPVPVFVPVPPRTTVRYSYLPTTVGTPLLEPRRPPSGALLGVLMCMFCFLLLVVAFVLWL